MAYSLITGIVVTHRGHYRPGTDAILNGCPGCLCAAVAGDLALAAGRPADVLVMPDGSRLVSDDKAGRIYRTTYAPGARPARSTRRVVAARRTLRAAGQR